MVSVQKMGMRPNCPAVVAMALRATYVFLAVLKMSRRNAALVMQTNPAMTRGASLRLRRSQFERVIHRYSLPLPVLFDLTVSVSVH